MVLAKHSKTGSTRSAAKFAAMSIKNSANNPSKTNIEKHDDFVHEKGQSIIYPLTAIVVIGAGIGIALGHDPLAPAYYITKSAVSVAESAISVVLQHPLAAIATVAATYATTYAYTHWYLDEVPHYGLDSGLYSHSPEQV